MVFVRSMIVASKIAETNGPGKKSVVTARSFIGVRFLLARFHHEERRRETGA
jgi:hypothetical protein